MSFIKIIQPGWEGYNGPMFGINFAEGKSLTTVDPHTAARIGSIILVEREDGTNPSASQIVLDGMCTPATLESLESVPADSRGPTIRRADRNTREQLEAMADTHGIVALRTIGDKIGVRSNSIGSLIDKIIGWQETHESLEAGEVAVVAAVEVAPTAEVVETVVEVVADEPARG